MQKQPYLEKFETIRQQTLYDRLDETSRRAIRVIASDYLFTLQELKRSVDAALDLRMWEETDFSELWNRWRRESALEGRQFKKWAFGRLEDQLLQYRQGISHYRDLPRQTGKQRSKSRPVLEERPSGDRVFGMCPVMSEKTLCCNLRTIDAVRNCGFACNYCSIQTLFPENKILFDRDFSERLQQIRLAPDRDYHIGTGQSSDALMWGNRHNILADLLAFAEKWPRVLLEFKTKSANVSWLCRVQVPRNVVCSWSLNPDVVIANEELRTASLEDRLQAARKIADRNIRVAFHLHPMIHYQDWLRDYRAMISMVMDRFDSGEILFVSFGSLTFPKPVLKKLRKSGVSSRISRTRMVPNPEGKLTYPDEIKLKLFREAYQAFRPWHGQVFFYLCMEEARFWDDTFGWSYPDNPSLEKALLESALAKLPVK